MKKSGAANSEIATSVAENIDRLGKLGLGSVTEPQTRTWALRTIFFWVTDQKARPTIDALAASCRAPFSELRKISKEILPHDHSDFPALVITAITEESVTWRAHDVRDWSSLCVAAQHFPSADDLRTTIWNWAAERNLAVEWFLDAAYLMLCIGAAFPGACPWSYGGTYGIAPGGLRAGGPIAGQLLRLESSKPLPVPRSYNPAVQDRDEYLLAVQEQFQDYCKAVEGEFRHAGFEPTIRKRQRSGPRWMHVEWFVRNRIDLWPQTRIAVNYRVSEDVVSKAVRKTAEFLGFCKGRTAQSGGKE